MEFVDDGFRHAQTGLPDFIRGMTRIGRIFTDIINKICVNPCNLCSKILRAAKDLNLIINVHYSFCSAALQTQFFHSGYFLVVILIIHLNYFLRRLKLKLLDLEFCFLQ